MSKAAIRVVVVASSLLGAGACAQVLLDTQTLYADGMWNNPTSIAVDSAGVVHVTWMAEFDTNSASKEVWYGNNAGGTFEAINITNNSVREEYPCLELDDDDNVHLVFHTGTPTTNYIRYTTNRGGANAFDFQPIVDITPPGFIIAEMDLDSQGTAHIVCFTQTDGAEDVYYRTIDANGVLGALENVTHSVGEEQYPDVAVGPDDTVHLVYQQGDPFGGPLVYMTRAVGETSFTAHATGVSGAVQDAIVRVDDSGRVCICYRVGATSTAQLLLITQTTPGGSFGAPVALTPPGVYRPAFRDNFAIAPDGRRFIPFASNVGQIGYFLVEEVPGGGFYPPALIENASGTKVGTSAAIGGGAADPLLAVTWQYGVYDSGADVVFADIQLGTASLGAECGPDLTDDGVLDFFDVAEFLSLFSAQDPVADFAPDGVFDFFDVAEFLDQFAAGCA